MMTETEKFQKMEFAYWRTGEADGVSPSLKMKHNQEHDSPRAGENGCPSLGREEIDPSSKFCSIQALSRLDDGRGQIILMKSTDLSYPSFRNTLTDPLTHYVLPGLQAFLSLVILTYKINHHTSLYDDCPETPWVYAQAKGGLVPFDQGMMPS